jgi:hypothetical protein
VRYLLIPAYAVFHPSRPLQLQNMEPDPADRAVPSDVTVAHRLAAIIGAPFEVFAVPGEAWMCANEARPAMGLAENIVATALAHHIGSISTGSYIAGPAVVLGKPDPNGFHRDIPASALVVVRELGCTVDPG